MAISIPFIQSRTNYTLNVPVNDEEIQFAIRWNSTDEAWYLDLYEADDTVIALNIKLALGVRLGRTYQHTFFDTHLLQVVDTTGEGREAAFDDLGTRVQLIVQNISDLTG